MKTDDRVTITRLTELQHTDSTVYVGYEVRGRLLADIIIGRPIRLDRFERNGQKVPGLFTTSYVTQVYFHTPHKADVHTGNSVYRVDVTDEETV